MDVPGLANSDRAMKQREIVFRVDASLDMGTGHVMRCLTLANTLRERGSSCHFICREHPGNLIDFVRAQGYQVHSLSCPSTQMDSTDTPVLAHEAWLGASQTEDAAACEDILRQIQPTWLVVDHYALDVRWQKRLELFYEHLMVIDDLADRSHQCDLLLDQTFGREVAAYKHLVPAACNVFCGAEYALLRPEFAEWRVYSLARRQSGEMKRILVSMGGVDRENATGRVLDALDKLILPENCQVEVVMGGGAPWLEAVRKQAATLNYPTRVQAGVTEMARLMADCDLAIGAAGATAWERCCLGLPTVMVILAENQLAVARGLQTAGAAKVITSPELIPSELPRLLQKLIPSGQTLMTMSQAAAQVTDGQGVDSIIQYLQSI